MGKSSTLGRSRAAVFLPLILAAVLAPLVLVLVALEVRREFQREDRLLSAVHHSYRERLQLQTVFSLLQDLETGQRGYVITGDPDYLRPYTEAQSRLQQEIAALEAMQRSELDAEFGGEPGELQNLQRLKLLIDERLDLINTVIELRRNGGAQSANAMVSAGEGKRVMDQIRSIVRQMTHQEAEALAERVKEHEEATASTRLTARVMFAVLCLALLMAYGLALRQWLKSQRLLAEVQATAARQTAVFESALDGMITFNPSGTIESMNRAGEAMFGRSRAELVRRDLTLLLEVPDSGDLFLDRLAAGGDLERGITRELVGRRADGTTFPVEATFGVFVLADGKHVVAAVRDISERRRVDRMKSEFISTVSHELRTPLTSIAGSLGLLSGGAAGDLPERAARLLTIAHANSQRLVRLINDILDMEKIESGQMTFAMSPVDVAELTRRAVDGMSGLADELAVRFELRTAEELPLVQADADRIIQVLSNLLSNAAKFSPTGGEVEVSLKAAGASRVRISVRDHGQGVPPEFTSRIFSKFAQADASDTRQKGGTGLGLAISREIVDRHGGRLWFENLTQGAVFHVDLPALHTGQAATGGRPCVLLCEDDPDIAEILRQMLDGEGFAVDWVSTLAATEERLAGEHFTALVLDIHLPDGNGLDLLKRLRANPETQRLPVLVVSADPQGKQALPLDVLDWLQKPIDTTRLRAALETATEGNGGRPLVLHVEDDLDVRQVVSDALSNCCEVMAAGSLDEARRMLAERRPKLAILDIALGDGSGLELLPLLQNPGEGAVPVIIFSAQSVDDASLTASVEAVLTKSITSLDQLGEMVRKLSRQVAAREGERG